MSISSVTSHLLQPGNPPAIQGSFKKFRTEFNQLRQDLQAGNIGGAKQDYIAVRKDFAASFLGTAAAPGAGNAASTPPSSLAFHSLGQDLKAGNLTGAQHDFVIARHDLRTKLQNHHELGGNTQVSGYGGDSAGAPSQAQAAAQQAYAALQGILQGQAAGGVAADATDSSFASLFQLSA